MKEKDMKRNLAVLVLLVTWSLLSTPMLTSAACTVQVPENLDSSDGPAHQGPIVSVSGATDDGTGGDPGDAGDGYGVTDQPDSGGGIGEFDGVQGSNLGELLFILQSLIQLVF
jgi:hypothetical protein